ncbi:MAG: anti-sigma factor [Melioribacteraceae bacterium]|nr:anti-sigma factor [Melioribacteraceae bacterium]
MADNTVNQIICAYSLGCLDRENFIQFVNYIDGGGELPHGEMGELQNVTALIPVLLAIENPPIKAKNDLAKRVLEIEEKRKKKTAEVSAEEAEASNAFGRIIPGFKQEEKQVSDPEQKPVSGRDKLHDITGDQNIIKSDGTNTTKKNISYLPWIILAILTVLLFALTIYFSNATELLETEISELNNQITGLKREVNSTNRFITENIELIEFLNNKKIDIVNLQSSELNPDSYGKLLISFDTGEALLQMKDMPPISDDESYQLWMIGKTESFSLGIILPRPGYDYYRIYNVPSVDKKDIRLFRITKENKAGTETPTGSTYLFGTVNDNAVKKTTRRR